MDIAIGDLVRLPNGRAGRLTRIGVVVADVAIQTTVGTIQVVSALLSELEKVNPPGTLPKTESHT